jgi:hypothetical protein
VMIQIVVITHRYHFGGDGDTECLFGKKEKPPKGGFLFHGSVI